MFHLPPGSELQPPSGLRNPPTQARSRERLQRVLDAAEQVLADDGVPGLTTAHIAQAAGVSVGAVYRFFDDKEAIVEALAVRHWSDLLDLIDGLAEADERTPLDDPAAEIIDALAAGFRSRPAFRALWFGGLRTERIRDVTRPARGGFASALERMLAVRWPKAEPALRERVATTAVLVGDGLLREAFRVDPDGDDDLLGEAKRVLNAYLRERLS